MSSGSTSPWSPSGLHQRLVRRNAGPLTAARASARLSAYVYGNVLTLAAVVAAGQHTIETGAAALFVVGTTVTTLLAHVFAQFVATSNIPEAHPHVSESERGSFARAEIRDAIPIASSGAFPALILALAWLDVLPAWWAQLGAGAVVVVRIAMVRTATERLRGSPPSFRVFLGGLTTAAVAAVIVLLKVLIGH
ncbi:hypothetical protein [Williamsia sp. R60]